MEPGDIYYLNHSAVKARPVLVLAVGPTGAGEDEVVVVATLSSVERLFHRRYKGDVILDQWQQFGLNRPTVLRCRQINSYGQHVFGGWLGRVDPETLHNAQTTARALLASF